MTSSILNIDNTGSPWKTIDPFLACVHHIDEYPAGNSDFGPRISKAGRAQPPNPVGENRWRMYFGRTVPGFPAHPHRGFETITILRRGVIDHSDSLGASARFGAGDVQWLTAGRGIVHAEMFPLLDPNRPNPLDLFQIWLNLPARHKLVEPHFTMFWAGDIPHDVTHDADRVVDIRYVAGTPADTSLKAPPAPPPNSWAADPTADLAIWTIKMSPGARLTLPPTFGRDTRRQLIFFAGATLSIDNGNCTRGSAIEVRCTQPVEVINGSEPSEILMLQGRPIGEPVVQHGPFVMNSADEIRQAYAEYGQSKFGNWAWSTDAPVHGSEKKRFATR